MLRYVRWLEFFLLFIGAPLLLNAIQGRWFILIALWVTTAVIFIILKRQPGFSYREEWRAIAITPHSRQVILLFLLAVPVLVGLTYLIDPNLLLSLPRTRPQLWAIIMVLYPILSVWPQELIFRSWIYHRYQPLWRTPKGYVLLSAASFGFMHMVFHNWIAVILATIGGIIFAGTYVRTRSLALCCLEHALYGCAIFTIGLGHYFYNGGHFH